MQFLHLVCQNSKRKDMFNRIVITAQNQEKTKVEFTLDEKEKINLVRIGKIVENRSRGEQRNKILDGLAAWLEYNRTRTHVIM